MINCHVNFFCFQIKHLEKLKKEKALESYQFLEKKAFTEFYRTVRSQTGTRDKKEISLIPNMPRIAEPAREGFRDLTW